MSEEDEDDQSLLSPDTRIIMKNTYSDIWKESFELRN